MHPAEQEMVAAERIFQYLQLGSGSSYCGSGSSSGAGDQGILPSSSDGSISSRFKSRAAAAVTRTTTNGDLEEQRQPLLCAAPALPLQLPAAAGSGGGTWLHSGHVRFDNVWLRYEHWHESRGRGGAACANTHPAAPELPGAAPGSPADGSAPWVLRGVSLDVAPGEPARRPQPGASSQGQTETFEALPLLSTHLGTQPASRCTYQRSWRLVPKALLINISLGPPLPAGSHVGICGRTGAGKSSLLAALLRLAPIHSGRITIDGRDIATVDPAELRRAVGEVAPAVHRCSQLCLV